MALYFKNKRQKTFLGAPVGWPLMFLMAVDLCIAALMFLSDHDWSGLILLYPPLALALAMLADARKEKQAAEEAKRQAARRQRRHRARLDLHRVGDQQAVARAVLRRVPNALDEGLPRAPQVRVAHARPPRRRHSIRSTTGAGAREGDREIFACSGANTPIFALQFRSVYVADDSEMRKCRLL